MSFIKPDGARTVYNCTAFDKRKVYEIDASATLVEVESVGAGEVERTGRYGTEGRTYHVVATSEALARALFADRYAPECFAVQTVTALFVIDEEIVAR
jgi:hypothetical protein